MGLKYMAIDKDVDVHNREKMQWRKRDISEVRVDSMAKSIEKAISNPFLFIVINADNINYMPTLKILREVTNDPILIATSTFTFEEQAEALNYGADFYGEFSESDKDMKIVLAVVSGIAERTEKRKIQSKIITHGDVLIIEGHHKAFVKDVELQLTKTEMQIFHYLVMNRGCILTHKQIQQKIWPDECGGVFSDNLYSIIKRMRQKIRRVSSQKDYIQTVRDVGYRFSTE